LSTAYYPLRGAVFRFVETRVCGMPGCFFKTFLSWPGLAIPLPGNPFVTRLELVKSPRLRHSYDYFFFVSPWSRDAELFYQTCQHPLFPITRWGGFRFSKDHPLHTPSSCEFEALLSGYTLLFEVRACTFMMQTTGNCTLIRKTLFQQAVGTAGMTWRANKRLSATEVGRPITRSLQLLTIFCQLLPRPPPFLSSELVQASSWLTNFYLS